MSHRIGNFSKTSSNGSSYLKRQASWIRFSSRRRRKDLVRQPTQRTQTGKMNSTLMETKRKASSSLASDLLLLTNTLRMRNVGVYHLQVITNSHSVTNPSWSTKINLKSPRITSKTLYSKQANLPISGTRRSNPSHLSQSHGHSP